MIHVSRSRSQSGFTLIEVLVALAIVTIGMGALLAALGSSADSTGYQRDKTFAEWVALNRIEEVRLAMDSALQGAFADPDAAARAFVDQIIKENLPK